MHPRWLFVPLAASVACTDGQNPPPAPTCPVRQGDPRVTVGTGRARVTLRLDRFGMQVKNGDAVLLDTLDTTADTPDDTSRPFGALGATRRNVSIRPPQLLGDGWDRATLVDDPWVHGTTVSAARVEGNTATIDLCDPAHVASPLRVTVTVLDDEVRVEARASALRERRRDRG